MEKSKENSYRKLIVHQKSDDLAFEVYEITTHFPKDELFGMVSQMRRAAVSVPANIAEGYMRHGVKEKIRFFNVAQGSLVELEYFIDFAKRLNYINQASYIKLCKMKDETGKLLNGYLKALKMSCNKQVEAGV
jgi:four helix bundle protein